MNRITNSLLAVVVAAVGATACTSAASETAGASDTAAQSTTSAPSTTVSAAPSEVRPPTDGAERSDGTLLALGDLEPDLATMLTRTGEAYRALEGVWAGFVPNDHPVVLAIKDSAGAVTGAVAINHPAPGALGTSTAVSLDGLPFTSLHMIEDPTDAAELDRLESFDFHATLGGVDSFAMIAGGGDAFFDPASKDYVSTLLHEMFHRYQDEGFKGSLGAQDVEGYAYTAENLSLAVLEDRALDQAITATDDDGRLRAARWFAAIRKHRLAVEGRVALDEGQEMFEGTARYIEHRLAGADSDFAYHDGNYERELLTAFETRGGVKDQFGFGRFYASGAAVLRVLDLTGATGVPERVEAGESPASILADETGVTAAEVEELVADAKANLDPRDQLSAEAAEAAAAAVDEPPVFGGDSGSADGSPTEDGEVADGDEITDEQFQCLIDGGLDPEGGDISDELAEACL